MTIKCLNIGLYQSMTDIFEYLFVSNFGNPEWLNFSVEKGKCFKTEKGTPAWKKYATAGCGGNDWGVIAKNKIEKKWLQNFRYFDILDICQMILQEYENAIEKAFIFKQNN